MRTPRARIKGILRQMFVSSNERSEALKKTSYCCNRCGIKQSQAKGREVKLNVHHKEGINCWQEIIDLITDKLLCDPDKLEVLCVDCHNKEHK